jgi:hypothetical protein
LKQGQNAEEKLGNVQGRVGEAVENMNEIWKSKERSGNY